MFQFFKIEVMFHLYCSIWSVKHQKSGRQYWVKHTLKQTRWDKNKAITTRFYCLTYCNTSFSYMTAQLFLTFGPVAELRETGHNRDLTIFYFDTSENWHNVVSYTNSFCCRKLPKSTLGSLKSYEANKIFTKFGDGNWSKDLTHPIKFI